MALRLWKFGLAAAVARALGASAQAGPPAAVGHRGPGREQLSVHVRRDADLELDSSEGATSSSFTTSTASAPGRTPSRPGSTLATMNTGGNPGRTVPNDNPEMPNLVWTYTGDTPLVGQIGLGNFTALSNKPESTSRPTSSAAPTSRTRTATCGTRTTSPTRRPRLGRHPAAAGQPAAGQPAAGRTAVGRAGAVVVVLLAAGLPLVARGPGLRGTGGRPSRWRRLTWISSMFRGRAVWLARGLPGRIRRGSSAISTQVRLAISAGCR